MATAARRKELSKRKRERDLRMVAAIAKRIDRDKLDDLIEGLDDGWEPIRRKIIDLAGDRGDWAGYPLPIKHASLVIEPRHPLHATLNGASLGKDEPIDNEGAELINGWHDASGGEVIMWREADGSIHAHSFAKSRSLSTRGRMTLDTLAASQAWSVRAEFTAMARLKTLVTPVAMRYYILTGTFLETSKRSGVVYLFRKCRPTLAIRATETDSHVLAALCLHPIGYYESTFAGSMVPTDDVIAHLVMMRGDERKFWSKCNQHNPKSAEAGI